MSLINIDAPSVAVIIDILEKTFSTSIFNFDFRKPKLVSKWPALTLLPKVILFSVNDSFVTSLFRECRPCRKCEGVDQAFDSTSVFRNLEAWSDLVTSEISWVFLRILAF